MVEGGKKAGGGGGVVWSRETIHLIYRLVFLRRESVYTHTHRCATISRIPIPALSLFGQSRGRIQKFRNKISTELGNLIVSNEDALLAKNGKDQK
jgi:hypothetical protein